MNKHSGEQKQQYSGVKFFLLGAISFVLAIGITAFCHEVIFLSEETSYFIAIINIFIINFFGARHFVFAATNKPVLEQFLQFTLSSLFFRGAEFLAFFLLYTFLGFYYLLATATVMIISFVCKYIFYKVNIFNQE